MKILFILLLFISNVYSLEILFNSDNHGTLYPCNCPRNPAGGLAKRGFVIDSLRANSKEDILVLDGGDFSAGGKYDMYSNNIREEDSLKTLYTLYSLKEMKYDVIGIGDEDLNYGIDFLKNINLPFISANLYSDSNFQHRIFKKVKIVEKNNKKIAIVSIVTPKGINNNGEFFISNPIEELKKVYSEVMDKVDLFVILNHCGQDYLEDISGIIKDKDVKKTIIFNSHYKKGRGYAYQINNIPIINFKYIVKSLHKLDYNMDSSRVESLEHINLGLRKRENKNIKNLLKEYELVKRKVLNGIYGKLRLDFYAMSDCPYCAMLAKDLLPFIEKNKDRINFNLYFIMDNEDGIYSAMHGENEVKENLYQIALQAKDRSKFLEFLNYKYIDKIPLDLILDSLKIKKSELDSFLNTRVGKSALRRNDRMVRKNNVVASPTLFIDGEKIEGVEPLTKILRNVCTYYKFDECKKIEDCYIDTDCNKRGLIGTCDTTGQKNRCKFIKDTEFDFIVLYDKTAISPFDSTIISETEKVFPSVNIKYLDYQTEEGKTVLKKLKIKKLPAYFATKNIEKASKFKKVGSFFTRKFDYYMLEGYDENVTIYLNRKYKKGLEVLISPNVPILKEKLVFSTIRDLMEMGKIDKLGFVIFNDGKELNSLGGKYEVETIERMATIEENHNKSIFIKYLDEWRKNPNTSYWQDAIEKVGLSPEKIKNYIKTGKIKNSLLNYSTLWDKKIPVHYLYILVNNRELYKISVESFLKKVNNILLKNHME